MGRLEPAGSDSRGPRARGARVPAIRPCSRLPALASLAAAATLLAGCGQASSPPLPPAHSAAERQWLDNVASLVRTLATQVDASTVGGGNLASARRVLHDTSSVYTLLVAYDLFGDCGGALANAGTASARAGALEQTLIDACARLEDAAALFQRAMTRRSPQPLLRASRTVLATVPLLGRARAELALLEGSGGTGGAAA